MGNQFQREIRRQHRRGIFEGYNVSGFQYESLNGELAWHITAWPGRDPVNSYWVTGGKFHGVRIDFLLDETQIEIFNEITNVNAKEREAVLKAITEWEKSVEAEASEAEEG
jgi:hypothetical protein